MPARASQLHAMPRACRTPGLLTSFLLAVALAAGCSATPEPAASVAPPRAVSQQLRVAVGDDEFLRGGPVSANLGLLVDGLNPGIFETLTTITPSFGLRPGLALRWQARTPTEWRFELRPDIRFHNGMPLTAQAVVESLQRFTGGTTNAQGDDIALRATRPRGLEPTSATAIDALTVGIELSAPNLRLAEQLASPAAAIIAPGTAAGDGTSPATTPTGTGPFRFASYRPGTELAVIANDDYWDRGPELESIAFRFGPEKDASRLLATGQVDVVGHISTDLLANVTDGEDREVNSAPTRSVLVLLNRGGVGPWATLHEDAVREAIAHALNRRAIADKTWPDGEPNNTLIPAAALGAAGKQIRPPGYDITTAKELLNVAGWRPGADGVRARGGQPLTLNLLVRRSSDGLPAAAALIGQQLRDVGIATTITVPSPGPPQAGTPTALQQVNAATFDLFLDIRPQDDANPCALCRFFTIRPGSDLTISGVVGAGPAADTLYDRSFSAPTLDAARRLAADLVQEVVSEQVVAIPIATLPNSWLLSPQAQNFDPAPVSGTQQWNGLYLSR